MYDKIKNPLTGRFVRTTSKLGKSIISNYINQLGGSVCGVNPKTNRCNKKFSDNNPELCELGPKGRCRKVTNVGLIKKAQNRGTAPSPRTIQQRAAIRDTAPTPLNQAKRLTDAEKLGLLFDYDDLSDEEHDKLYKKLGTLEYEPGYKSAFNGQSIDVDVYKPEDVLWWQASDKLAAHLKYGDEL